MWLRYGHLSKPLMDNDLPEYLLFETKLTINRPKEKLMITFEEIWNRIVFHAGEDFHQIRGGVFNYTIDGNSVALDRTNQTIARSHFKEASGLVPLKNTLAVQHLRGPSYIYAILMDKRIRKADW